jgi:hypothetical protein
MRRLRRLLLAGLLTTAFAAPAGADAIVRTQAMLASTVAEYFIDEDRVILELEIGAPDVEAFANLLPDELYERLGNPPKPLIERLALFVREDCIVALEDAPPLPGRPVAIEPRTRVRRDEISGEPLLDTEEEPEIVIFARLEYPLPFRPSTLILGGSVATRTGIGFVAYHQEIAINDFRYLAPGQAVDLDWEDPWYSEFRARSLRRTYFAPANGFIYIEPYEVRKEVVIRPKDLQHWVDLGLEGRDTIPAAMQEDLKRTAAEFLRQRHEVRIDGETLVPDLAQINFLERTLRTSRVIYPPVDISVNAAILGAIFVYPTVELPEHVTMKWDLFNERLQQIPVASVDQAGALPSYLDPDYPILEWQNFLKNPELPTLTTLAHPPGGLERWSARLRWVLLPVALAALVIWAVVRRRGRDARRPAVLAGVLVLAAAASLWIGGSGSVSEGGTQELVHGLLHNVYRAFDFRDEEKIYDVLAQSVDGELLTTIYLETRRGLELAAQGGARAKVKQIELVELETRSTGGGGFTVTATWNVGGSVGHWGHLHQRRNQYTAELGIRPVDGAWKLTELEILQEERL